MRKSKKGTIKTGVLLSVIAALMCLCAFLGVQALTNNNSMKFNLGTRFDAEIMVRVDIFVDGQYKTIFNSSEPTAVDYTASYIDSISGDTINLSNSALPIENNAVTLKFYSFETDKKVNVYINGDLQATLNKAPNSSTPSSQEVVLSTLSTENLLGAFLVSLRFDAVTEFTVTYITNSNHSVENEIIQDGQIITPPTLEDDLKTFVGWFTDSALTQPFNAGTTINDDITLYAKWLEPCTIVFSTNGGSAVSDMQVKQGSTLSSLPQTTYSGHEFDGWFLDSNFNTQFVLNSTIIDSNKTLYAKWTKLYTVTFIENGGTTVADKTVRENSTIELPSTSKNGYDFLGWFMDEDCNTAFNQSTQITSNYTLYAGWEYIIRVFLDTTSGFNFSLVYVLKIATSLSWSSEVSEVIFESTISSSDVDSNGLVELIPNKRIKVGDCLICDVWNTDGSSHALHWHNKTGLNNFSNNSSDGQYYAGWVTGGDITFGNWGTCGHTHSG